VSKCRKLFAELSNYLDGDVDPDMRRDLEEHIAKCPNCLVVIDTTQQTIRVFQGCEPYPLPEDMHDKLLGALRKRYETAAR
jgi:anti-sigma factor (TIGR02949 family)